MSFLKRGLELVGWSHAEKKYRLEEDDIPVDKQGKPDLSRYTKPLEHYIALYEASLEKIPATEMSRERTNLAFRQRVHASWGLGVKGAEAIPYLLTLIGRSDPDAREDGAYLLGELKKAEGIADALLTQLDQEQDLVAKSAMIDALGKLRYQPAVPALARLVLRKNTDNDLRLDAVESLSRIVKDNFSKSNDPVGNAVSWLKSHGYTAKEPE